MVQILEMALRGLHRLFCWPASDSYWKAIADVVKFKGVLFVKCLGCLSVRWLGDFLAPHLAPFGESAIKIAPKLL